MVQPAALMGGKLASRGKPLSSFIKSKTCGEKSDRHSGPDRPSFTSPLNPARHLLKRWHLSCPLHPSHDGTVSRSMTGLHDWGFALSFEPVRSNGDGFAAEVVMKAVSIGSNRRFAMSAKKPLALGVLVWATSLGVVRADPITWPSNFNWVAYFAGENGNGRQ